MPASLENIYAVLQAGVQALNALTQVMKGPPKATLYATPADPDGTASTTGVMMGIGLSFVPRYSGNVMVLASCNIKNNTANGGGLVQIRYGTGSPPGNGAAPAGTALCAAVGALGITAAAGNVECATCGALATGLTIGTTYWLDLLVLANGGGTANPNDITISAAEI